MKKEFRFGEGKISSVLSALTGAMALGATLCFRFPEFLTTAELREVYPIEVIRLLVWAFIALSVVFGLLGAVLSKNKSLALLGIALSLLGAFLGGGGVEVSSPVPRHQSLGLDWFLLDLLLLAAVFVPLERIFALRREQKVFRSEWRTDLVYFGVNHMLLSLIMVVCMAPSLWIRQAELLPSSWRIVESWPAGLQFLALVASVDLFQYWVHRAFHVIPFLWRFHKVHHSPEQMDWLAGSRLHIVDVVVTRSILFLPLSLLGFGEGPLRYYIVFAAAQTVFIHSNTRWRFDWLRVVLATPAFHHWHHSSEMPALDKNFAVHLPLLDYLFGTAYSPKGRWPRKYGIR